MYRMFEKGVRFEIEDHEYGLFVRKKVDGNGKLLMLYAQVCDFENEEDLDEYDEFEMEKFEGKLSEEEWREKILDLLKDVTTYSCDDKPTDEELSEKLVSEFEKIAIRDIKEEV